MNHIQLIEAIREYGVWCGRVDSHRLNQLKVSGYDIVLYKWKLSELEHARDSKFETIKAEIEKLHSAVDNAKDVLWNEIIIGD